MEYLHIRMDLLRQYSYGETSKVVKFRKETLCFAIWCKMQHSNSVMFQLTKKDLKKRLRIGYDKAKKLLKSVKEDSLFQELGNGRFLVNTFRDKSVKWNKKNGNYQGAVVCRVPVNKDFTLKELYHIVNNILFTFVICGAKDNCFNVGKNSGCVRTFLTTKKFSKVVNMGRSSISRIKKSLIEDGKISSTLAEIHMADTRNEVEANRTLMRYGYGIFTFVRGDRGYIVIPCSYSIEDRDVDDTFMHKIYGYKTKNRTLKDVLYNNSVNGMPD